MSGPDDELDATLARAFERHARNAPHCDVVNLMTQVKSGVRARRLNHIRITAVVIAVVAILIPVVLLIGKGPDSPTSLARGDEVEWRWESYRGIELRVPNTWEYGVQWPGWCADSATGTTEKPGPGAVGRPGVSALVKCSSAYPPLEQRAPWVMLGAAAAPGTTEIDGGWVAETRKIGSIVVIVFSGDADLRSAILDSARKVTGNDSYGCTPHHAATVGREFRPQTQHGSLPVADEVTSISVCRYARSDTSRVKNAILSAGRLSGQAAKEMLEAIHQAPQGFGPDNPRDCLPEVAYGDEVLVLRIHSRGRVSEVVVRYHGCEGHGIYDATMTRKLTKKVVKPLLTGPHQPSVLSSSVAEFVW